MRLPSRPAKAVPGTVRFLRLLRPVLLRKDPCRGPGQISPAPAPLSTRSPPVEWFLKLFRHSKADTRTAGSLLYGAGHARLPSEPFAGCFPAPCRAVPLRRHQKHRQRLPETGRADPLSNSVPPLWEESGAGHAPCFFRCSLPAKIPRTRAPVPLPPATGGHAVGPSCVFLRRRSPAPQPPGQLTHHLHQHAEPEHCRCQPDQQHKGIKLGDAAQPAHP